MDVTADSIDKLRQRTSMKWRAFPDDVLPLFVAETDYPLAPPIAEVLAAAEGLDAHALSVMVRRKP